MQAAEFADGDDLAHLRRLDGSAVRGILGESEVGPGVMVVREYAVRMGRRWRSLRTMTWSRQSRRIEPIRRSANGFCHGLRGAVRTSSICMPFMRWRKHVSVNRIAIAEEIGGAVSSGKLSTIC
jgi:hypothetical protein